MFNFTTKYTKVYRKYGEDGKIVEESIETTENPDEVAKATDAAVKKGEEMFSKMDRFVKKMNEAFKELF